MNSNKNEMITKLLTEYSAIFRLFVYFLTNLKRNYKYLYSVTEFWQLFQYFRVKCTSITSSLLITAGPLAIMACGSAIWGCVFTGGPLAIMACGSAIWCCVFQIVAAVQQCLQHLSDCEHRSPQTSGSSAEPQTSKSPPSGPVLTVSSKSPPSAHCIQ